MLGINACFRKISECDRIQKSETIFTKTLANLQSTPVPNFMLLAGFIRL